jgi:hypothetical protein
MKVGRDKRFLSYGQNEFKFLAFSDKIKITPVFHILITFSSTQDTHTGRYQYSSQTVPRHLADRLTFSRTAVSTSRATIRRTTHFLNRHSLRRVVPATNLVKFGKIWSNLAIEKI